MKITKYPQSNFLIEKEGTRVLIDPGYLTFEKYKTEDFGDLSAILVSHRHWDHVDREPAKIWSREGVPIYGNSDVVQVLGEEDVKVNEIKNGQEFEPGGFKIKPIDLPHCQLLFCRKCNKQLPANELIPVVKKCKLHPEEELIKVDGPPNTGFLIDGVLFHPGDGTEIKDLITENAFISIDGPTIDFDVAWKFVQNLEAKRIIPMHYSHPAFPADPKDFIKENTLGIEVKILSDGESTEV